MGLIGNIFGGIALGALNNALGAERENIARGENFKYGEIAANNADARTRALYTDLYSPAAQLQQLKNAGLSPSLMYGDGGGISGQTGAQGTGAAGIAPNVYGIEPLTMSQIKVNEAQARKLNTEADTIGGENKRGVAEIANIWANTAEANANAELQKASKYLVEANTKYQDFLNWLNDTTKQEQAWKIKNDAATSANLAEKSFWEAQQAGLDFKFSEETYNVNKATLYEQLTLIIKQQGVADAEAEKLSKEIFYMPDYVDISKMNAETYAKHVEAQCENLPKVLEMRGKELNVEKWKIGVGAFTETVRTIGYFFGAQQLGDGGQILDETSTTYDKKGKPMRTTQTHRNVIRKLK